VAFNVTDIETTAVVVGAGPTGLVAACLLAQANIKTLCVAPQHVAADPRTVALMDPSIRLLTSLDLWTDDLRQHCAPLKQLHLRDDTGKLVTAPDLRFNAEEAKLEAFGWNTPLANLLPTLRQKAENLGVHMLDGNIENVSLSENAMKLQTSTGQNISASYAIAADGRKSKLRTAAGISVQDWGFDQTALVTRFAHSRDHEYVSTEWHKIGGPFTTVPLPGLQSALVWMDRPAKIDALMQLTPRELAREIQLQSHGTLGLISDVRAPHAFPMHGVMANSFAKRRVYLVGEAAHAFPPIGAQGLNMSFRDAGHMIDVVLAHQDPGSDAAMSDYDKLRQPDIKPRQMAISMMNRTLLSEISAPHLARSLGLAAVAYVDPLRKVAIAEGLSPSQGLPFAMRG
jgi:2-octaprenyl-6-methoxyphenol hydroxylase